MTSQIRKISIERIERIKCNSTLAITSVIKGTHQSRLYNELDPESFLGIGLGNCTFLQN